LIETNQASYSPPETHDTEMFDDGTIILSATSTGSYMIDLDRRKCNKCSKENKGKFYGLFCE